MEKTLRAMASRIHGILGDREGYPEEDERVKTLVRSLSVLDEWLEQNEGPTDDEVRVRRIRGWREEALQQLQLLLEEGRP
jgi:hypothetical protein